ncbi:MAG: hypothetical protein WAP55_03425 [Minisyncoccia bacterium]
MTAKAVPTDEQLGHFARHQDDVFDRARPQYPADGDEFELTFNFSAPEADPIEMVRNDGYSYSEPEMLQFTGQKLSGVQTRRFKLVRVGYYRNLDEVREKLAQYGPVPEGQWREAFKAAFPRYDGNDPVGFADPSWVFPRGYVRFPDVFSCGVSDFYWAGDVIGEFWRWLVPASPADKPASK